MVIYEYKTFLVGYFAAILLGLVLIAIGTIAWKRVKQVGEKGNIDKKTLRIIRIICIVLGAILLCLMCRHTIDVPPAIKHEYSTTTDIIKEASLSKKIGFKARNMRATYVKLENGKEFKISGRHRYLTNLEGVKVKITYLPHSHKVVKIEFAE